MKVLIAGLLLAIALPVGAQRGGSRGGGGFGGQRNDPFGRNRNDPMRTNPNSRLPREQKQKKEQKRPDCVSEIAGTKFPKKKPEYICEQNKKGKFAWRKLKKEEKEQKEAAAR
jgi:hypothetical protein